MGKHQNSVDSQILTRIRSEGKGWVFTPAHLMDLGSRNAIDLALMRHARAGTIRQLARGLYEVPKTHPTFGSVPADAETIAHAIAGRHSIRLQPAGAYAANTLGLSDQVPVRTIFLTDGPSRRIKVGKREIVLKHTTPRNMATAGRTSGMVIQALRWIGRRRLDEKLIARLRRNLKAADRAALANDAHLAPAWIASVLRQLATDGE